MYEFTGHDYISMINMAIRGASTKQHYSFPFLNHQFSLSQTNTFVLSPPQLFTCIPQNINQMSSIPPYNSTSSLLRVILTSLLVLNLVILLLPSSHSLATSTVTGRAHPQPLSINYYSKSCPQLEQLVASVTSQQFKQVPVTGPATIRLFFHDCFVEGCDASILISSKPGSKELAEKDAEDNKELAAEAFDSINKAKALVENKCPGGVVSCADILAIAARDYVHLAGGPYYEVKKGRWDGKISMASRVYANIPHANSTIDDLLKLFSSKGLSLEDLVVLSGAHSIGFAHCKNFVTRLYDYRGTKKPDPSIDPRLLKALQMSCPHYGGNTDIVAPFDVTTPFMFDNAYYQNLESKLGLLGTDQALFSDPRTKPLVLAMAKDKQKFFQAFGLAMEKMGSIGVKRGRRHGERKKDCSMHM